MRQFEWIIVNCKKYECNGSYEKIGDLLVISYANHLFNQVMKRNNKVSSVEFYNQFEMASFKGPYFVEVMTDSKVTLSKYNNSIIRQRT